MYTSFRIQNFRCFEDLELKDLARVNLIAGKNNTGKTSLLEAILLHNGHLDSRILLRYEEIIDAPFLVPQAPPLPAWNTLFYELDTKRKIAFEGIFEKPEDGTINFETVLETKIFRWSEYNSDYGDSDAKPYMINLPSEGVSTLRVLYQDEPYYLFPSNGKIEYDRKPIDHYFPGFLIPTYSNLAGEDVIGRFSRLIIKGKRKLLVETLNILEGRLESVEILFDVLYGNVGLSEPVPLKSMGEGMARVANLILAIANASGGVVLIDEIENGLHYSVLTDVWKAIGKATHEFDVQVFATTHSLEAISAAHEAFSESESYDFRYHRLDRDQANKVHAVTLNQQMLQTAEEGNFEIR